MEKLKELFGSESLSYEDFAKKVEEKKLKLADLSDGAYVSRDKFNEKLKELEEVTKKFDGVDLDKIKSDHEAEIKKYIEENSKLKKGYAIDEALNAYKAHDKKVLRALIDENSITFEGDKIIGLDEQVKPLKETKSFLFQTEQKNNGIKVNTAVSHDNQKTETANAEINRNIRAAAGKTI